MEAEFLFVQPIGVNLRKVRRVLGCEKSVVKWKHLLYPIETSVTFTSQMHYR